MAVSADQVDERRRERMVTTDVCVVRRWRGYRCSTFFACGEDGEALLESPSFRWRKPEPPPADSAGARAALAELAERLAADGWSRDEHQAAGRPWYEIRFVRAVTGYEPAPAEPAVVEEPLPPPEPAIAPVTRTPVLVLPPEAPPVAAARPRPRRRRVRVLVPPLACLALLGGVTLGRADRGESSATLAPQRHAAAAARRAPAVTAPVARKQAAPPAAPRIVHVSIAATDRSSWLELRRRSAKGPIVFSGELAPGKAVRASGSRLWARFGAAGNLTIRADGKPVRLLGTFEHVFAPAKR